MIHSLPPFIVTTWLRLPVWARAILLGVIVTSAGTLPWAFLVALNLKHWPSVPWAVLLTAVYIWFYWKYVRGAGWPSMTAETRRNHCRANDLSSDVWGPAIVAGILGLWALVLFQNVYNRMATLPASHSEDLSQVPPFTLVASLIMSAIVAGVAEESGFRGYMQAPLEKRYGPVIAILLTGTLFGFLHFSHREVTLWLMPWYIGVAAVYGMLAYLTNSILPSLVLHAGGNVLGSLSALGTKRPEWQTSSTPRPLIWETGTDSLFWLSMLGFFLVTAAAIYAYYSLAKVARQGQQDIS